MLLAEKSSQSSQERKKGIQTGKEEVKCHGLHTTPQNGSIAEIYKELQKHEKKPSKKATNREQN